MQGSIAFYTSTFPILCAPNAEFLVLVLYCSANFLSFWAGFWEVICTLCASAAKGLLAVREVVLHTAGRVSCGQRLGTQSSAPGYLTVMNMAGPGRVKGVGAFLLP